MNQVLIYVCICQHGTDAIVQLAIDNTRNILFSRSERGTIQVQLFSSPDYVSNLLFFCFNQYKLFYWLLILLLFTCFQQVFDLGTDGQGMSFITHLDQESIAYKASATIR